MREEYIGHLPDMWKETYDLVAQVPEGRVTTYGHVARALGDIVASRFVGLAMSRNDDIERVPCRRVVQSDGTLGGYTGGGPAKKKELLMREGIRIEGDRIADFEKVLFDDFRTWYPLRELKRRQTEMRSLLSLEDVQAEFERVAGVDVAYDDDRAYAAMVVLDMKSCEVVERHVCEQEAFFPYIPTYLAFREIPVIRSLVAKVDDSTLLMFDGNGILHPEGFGVTSQIGVVFDIPTVGVAKSLLCGSPSRQIRPGVQEIRLDGRVVGHAVTGRQVSKPIFVSAGHMISPLRALDITLGLMRSRVPEPVRLAHIAAEAAKREAKGSS